MRNWTIGKRIIFGGGTLLAMLLLIVGIAIASLKHLRNTVDARIAQDTMPGAIYSGLINNYMEDGFAELLLAGQADTPAERDKCLKVVAEDVAQTMTNDSGYEASITATEDRHNFDQFKSLEVVYTEARLKYTDLIKAGQSAEARSLLLAKLKPAYQAYTDRHRVGGMECPGGQSRLRPGDRGCRTYHLGGVGDRGAERAGLRGGWRDPDPGHQAGVDPSQQCPE